MTTITSLSKACYNRIRQLRCIRRYLDSSFNFLHHYYLYSLSFIPNSITVIISTIDKSQLSRLQQIQNSLARTVVKTLKSCHITDYALFAGSKSLNALNTSSSDLHRPTMFSQPLNLHTFVTSSLFNVLVVLALIVIMVLLLLGRQYHALSNN